MRQIKVPNNHIRLFTTKSNSCGEGKLKINARYVGPEVIYRPDLANGSYDMPETESCVSCLSLRSMGMSMSIVMMGAVLLIVGLSGSNSSAYIAGGALLGSACLCCLFCLCLYVKYDTELDKFVEQKKREVSRVAFSEARERISRARGYGATQINVFPDATVVQVQDAVDSSRRGEFPQRMSPTQDAGATTENVPSVSANTPLLFQQQPTSLFGAKDDDLLSVFEDGANDDTHQEQSGGNIPNNASPNPSLSPIAAKPSLYHSV